MSTMLKEFTSAEVSAFNAADWVSEWYKCTAPTNSVLWVVNSDMALDVDFEIRLPNGETTMVMESVGSSEALWRDSKNLAINDKILFYQFKDIGAVEMRMVLGSAGALAVKVLVSNELTRN